MEREHAIRMIQPDAIDITQALVRTHAMPVRTTAYSAFVQRKRAEFAHLAPQYEAQCLVSTLGRIGALRRRLAQMAAGDAEGPALELCCGTGGVTIELARRFEQVIGVDLSPEMLSRAHRRMRRHGVDNVTLREAEVSTLKIPDRSVAAVVISLGLHELPAWIRGQVLERAARWLQPGGRFVICDYVLPKNRALAAFFRWIGRIVIEEEHFDEYLAFDIAQHLRGLGYVELERRRLFCSCLEISAWTVPELRLLRSL
jgi:demethylmenaquinone methyltransferase/2-methoxy-6-polyprenyl-1,4-benzoquinol methylase